MSKKQNKPEQDHSADPSRIDADRIYDVLARIRFEVPDHTASSSEISECMVKCVRLRESLDQLHMRILRVEGYIKAQLRAAESLRRIQEIKAWQEPYTQQATSARARQRRVNELLIHDDQLISSLEQQSAKIEAIKRAVASRLLTAQTTKETLSAMHRAALAEMGAA